MTGFNISEWALKHVSFVWYLMFATLVGGVISYNSLGRAEDPSFTVLTMVVQTYWPGATEQDTLLQITDRIEKKLQQTPNLDHLRSYTQPGVSTIYVDLKDSTDPKTVPWLWYEVRKKVADIKATLPAGAQGPFFNDEFGDVYGIIYAFTGDGASMRQLQDYVESARLQLSGTADLGKTTAIGEQNQQYYLQFSAAKLAALGINEQDVIESLQQQNAVAPSGVVTTSQESIIVQVSGSFDSVQSFKATNLRVDGKFIRLGDIAEVSLGYVDPPSPLFRFNGKPAVGLGISMADGGNNLIFGDAIDKSMKQITANMPAGIEVSIVSNQPVVVKEAIGGFTSALWEAVFIVLAVSFVSLGMRAGFVVACSIPLVLAGTFIVMGASGISLERISLGALVIALGLLVDDAMITVEMMMSKLEEGEDIHKAATFAYTSTAFPMLTGTLVTVAGFVPIGFAQSSTGQYCFSLFAVIATALPLSWFVAVLYAPLLGVAMLPNRIDKNAEKKPNFFIGLLGRVVPSLAARQQKNAHKAKASGHGGEELGPLMLRFRALLETAMRFRWVTIGLTLATFALSLVGYQFLQRQFFPASDRVELLVNFTLPESASIYRTLEAVKIAEKRIDGDPRVVRSSFYVGEGAVRFYLPLNVLGQNNNAAQGVIVTRSLEDRDTLLADLDAYFAKEMPQVTTRIQTLQLGPPVDWPIEYRVKGPDVQKVRELANAWSGAMSQNPNVVLINYDWIQPQRKVVIDVDQNQARRVGASSKSIATQLNAVLSGTTITQVRDSIYLIDVMVRAINAERVSIDTIRNLQITVPAGTVPLSLIAKVSYSTGQPTIWRRDREPNITVQALTANGLQPATIVTQLMPAMVEFQKSMPAGYSLEIGGTVEKSQTGNASVIKVLPIMIFLILTILMIQLQSVQKMFLVISVAPLGLIGVVAAMLPTGTPMGFVAQLGVIALIGMIIRNSVILVAQIDIHMAEGESRWDAVIDATIHRLRPILLTAAAASLGMVPIASDVFWGPMAYAVIGGLASATLLTLIFLPALYCVWFRVHEDHGRTEPGVRA